MIRKVTIFFTAVEKEIEIDDNLDEREQEEELNRKIYNELLDDINNETMIKYWE